MPSSRCAPPVGAQTDPSRAQHPTDVTVGHEHDRAVDQGRPGPGQDAVGAGLDLVGALAAGDTMGPQRPARHVLADVGAGATLVVAVVPLDEVVVDVVDGKSAQLGGAPGAFARAGQHQGRVPVRSPAVAAPRPGARPPRSGADRCGWCADRCGSTPSHRGGSARAGPPRERRRPAPVRGRPDRLTCSSRAHGGAVTTSGPVSVQAALVSAKIVAISSMRSSSFWPSAGSTDALLPLAPAALVARLNRSCSCGYFSKCSGLK